MTVPPRRPSRPAPRRRGPILVLLLAALGAAAGCGPGARPSRPPSTVPSGPGERPWYAGTPEMRDHIRSLLAEVPRSTGRARIELGRRIVAYGEPAVPLLVDALTHPDPDLRGTAAWLLGFLGDPRAAPALVRATGDADPRVACEAGASLLRLGDDRGYERLVQGLLDPDARLRAQCILLLEHHTGETLDYRPDDAPDERAAAAARWAAWLRARRDGQR